MVELKKIVLINPSPERKYTKLHKFSPLRLFESTYRFPPLNLTILAALTPPDIEVRIIGLDWDSAVNSFLDMEHELMVLDWFPDYFDPDSYLFPQFHSWSMAPYGGNFFGLNNTDIDLLIEDGLLTTDEQERIQIYQEAQELIVEEIPCLFLYVPTGHDLVRFNVEGWVLNPSDLIELENVYKR